MNFLILSALLILSAPAFSFQPRPCAEKVWLKKGMFKKYDVNYTSIEFISFRTSSEEGSIKVSSASSTQNSTMSVDPGISTGQTESTTQFSSTYGDCSIWASNQKWLRREHYVAENSDRLKVDIAKGEGEYLETLMHLSGCPSDQKVTFSRTVQSHYGELFKTSEYWGLGSDIDLLLQNNPELRTACKVFPTNV